MYRHDGGGRNSNEGTETWGVIKTQRKKETETQRRGNKDPKREDERFREKETKTKTQRDGEIETQRKGVGNSKEKGRQRPRWEMEMGVCVRHPERDRHQSWSHTRVPPRKITNKRIGRKSQCL